MMSGSTPASWKSEVELAHISRTTLNDLPVPAGSWEANYARKQAKYNIQLAVASVVSCITLAVVGFNITIDFYIAHTPEVQINGLYNKNLHTK